MGLIGDVIMSELEKNLVVKQSEEEMKLTKKDIIAIMIAQFEILMPIALVFCTGIMLIILFLTKVWLRR